MAMIVFEAHGEFGTPLHVDGVSHLFHGRQGLTDILPCGNF
jgi:hypothetical protein